MEMVGLCRFSYLGHGGFKVTHDSLDERRAFLYAQDRMEDRFRHFEAITLPSIAGQTDPDFRLLTVVGSCFPRTYMDRLQALTRDVPQIEIIAYPPQRHRQAMIRVLRENRRDMALPSLQFRLDDDDAMGRDFVARFRETALDTAGFCQKHPAVAVDFNTGYVCRAASTGLQVCAYKYPYSAIALGMIVQPGCDETIMHFGHHKLWSSIPTITVPNEDMMMRSHNDYNDSRMKTGGREFDYQPLDGRMSNYISDRFNVDDNTVREVFSRPLP